MTAKERTWTAERVELLKSCVDAGLSCGQIAREIGVSRNAVIGKINRLQLSRCHGAIARQPERKRPRVLTQHHILMAVRAAPLPAADTLVPNGGRCSLMELNESKCRWPINDPGAENFCFCGNQAVAGLPYCAGHARIAYQPAARQRRVG